MLTCPCRGIIFTGFCYFLSEKYIHQKFPSSRNNRNVNLHRYTLTYNSVHNSFERPCPRTKSPGKTMVILIVPFIPAYMFFFFIWTLRLSTTRSSRHLCKYAFIHQKLFHSSIYLLRGAVRSSDGIVRCYPYCQSLCLSPSMIRTKLTVLNEHKR